MLAANPGSFDMVTGLVPPSRRFVNVFAERLMRSAGYEVLDAFSATAGDPALQGRDDGYHVGRALRDTLIDLTLNQVRAPLGSHWPVGARGHMREPVTTRPLQRMPRATPPPVASGQTPETKTTHANEGFERSLRLRKVTWLMLV